VNIAGKIVMLRAVENSDLPALHRWANDPATQDGIGELHFPSSMDFQEAWFRELRDDSLNQRFVVDVPDAGPIGLSSIVSIDWRNRHAWHGLVIGESGHRGRGLGVDAVMATMRFAFDELGLQRLDGSMIEYNAASLAMYCGGKLGWKEEGRRRSYFYRKGRFWDQVVVGITVDDYRALVAATGYWD
jgi:RimJ/RimL family protein N-acetyltransferase